jgi:hypothetical protein
MQHPPIVARILNFNNNGILKIFSEPLAPFDYRNAFPSQKVVKTD